MKYIILSNKKNALDRSAAIATAQGCGRRPEDVTRFWFPVVEHPDTKQGALAVPDAQEEGKLTGGETSKLKTRAELEAIGWFPKEEVKEPTKEGKVGTRAVDENTPLRSQMNLLRERVRRRLTVERWRVQGQGILWRYVLVRAGVIDGALVGLAAVAKGLGWW